MAKISAKEPVERVVIKIPRSIAGYFRQTFPHGKRSDFVAECIVNYKKLQELREIEEEFRDIGKKRV